MTELHEAQQFSVGSCYRKLDFIIKSLGSIFTELHYTKLPIVTTLLQIDFFKLCISSSLQDNKVGVLLSLQRTRILSMYPSTDTQDSGLSSADSIY